MVPENIHTPSQKGLEIPGRRGVSKTQEFKAMYEAKLEFPEGWGVIGQIPSVGGMDIFWNHTLEILRRWEELNWNFQRGGRYKLKNLGCRPGDIYLILNINIVILRNQYYFQFRNCLELLASCEVDFTEVGLGESTTYM